MTTALALIDRDGATEILVPSGGALVTIDERIDELELRIIEHPGIFELPVVHRFTPGLYSRELFAPAGTLATTYIHMQEHPYVVSQGVVSVFIDGVGWQTISAPYCGITQIGTRRVCFVHEDAVWTTFHPTTKTTVEEVERDIFAFRTLPDGTNARDRFKEALAKKALEGASKEIAA